MHFDHDQGTRRQIRFMLFKCSDDRAFQVIRRDIRSAHLKHAWTCDTGQRQHAGKVQIVSEHDVFVSCSPIHNHPVTGPRVAYR